MIAAMAMFATVACGEKEPEGPIVGAPKATIVATPASVGIDKAGAFNVTLDKAATAEVVITVTNANADFLTVAATEIKIAAGATTGTVAFTGKAAGAAKVTFTANTAAELLTKELTVTVTTVVEPGAEYEYPAAAWGTYFGMSKVVIGSTTVPASCENGAEANKPLIGDDGFMTGGISDDRLSTIVPLTDGVTFTIFADNFTSTSDKYDVFFYIDFNDNGKFEEATELVKVQKGIDGAKKTEITGTIPVPATAVASSRARIIVAHEENTIEDGIGDMDSGYMMDFMYSK